MKSRSAKNKGAAGQNEVKKLFQEFLGIPDDSIETAPMGTAGADVKFFGEWRKKLPFDVEVKRTEKASIWQWIEQATARNKHFRIPFRRNRSEWYVLMPLEDYLNMEKKLL